MKIVRRPGNRHGNAYAMFRLIGPDPQKFVSNIRCPEMTSTSDLKKLLLNA